MDVHLRDLRYFVTTAEELSFTRAAERLFISQPALSKQVRQLETQLRVRLFERDRRSVALTAPGAALLPLARELLRSWDEAQRSVGDAAATEAAVLTLGLSTSVGRGLLTAVRERFAERRPTWRLRMRQVNWEDASAGLAAGEVDAAFVWLPLPEQASFTLRVVAREQRWVAFREDHWLADRTEVDFAELLDEPFLALPGSAGPLRDHWLGQDARGGRPPIVADTVSNADETFTAVEEGTGIVLLAAGNAAIYRRPGTRAIPVTGLSPSELALAWRPDDHRPVLRDLAAALPDLPAPA
ncbi:LysR family transcriptional regulator [Streptomyces hoynatensis]|uniref:LysR family transcriptional regulator n=1 Tax=Streptomyces hoynatensis TaxID=1141874 RepID=A0A3A9YLQ0_9ACTN|nr:LysR substrate-binding domain-containing protein [Streptomyces hoynatensis]RKN35156.1 LysR family transcriptional regulator [Streptomyces hoynatensis]